MSQELFVQFLKGQPTALDGLIALHRFRLERFAAKRGLDPVSLIERVRESLLAQRGHLLPAPDFLHWLFLFTLHEMRLRETGYEGFDGLFETPEETFSPTFNFKDELNKYLESMTDEKMEHYRLRFEDGLVFEEMAAHLPKPGGSKSPTTWNSWLEEWKQFLKPSS